MCEACQIHHTPCTDQVAHRTTTITFRLSPEDAVAYSHTIPHPELESVRVRLGILDEIHAAPKILPACKRIAARLNRPGLSAKTLHTDYYKYTRGSGKYPAGDWRILLNKSKAPIGRQDQDSVSRRIPFIEFWRSIGERFHQDWAAAHDELLKIWRTCFDSLGKRYTQIPGYAQWPAVDPWFGHPAGWSYANLMRYQSDIYDQTAARIGHAKASEHRLPVLLTRVGLQFGQFIEFDDHEFNQRVLFQDKPMRPLGFGAVEVLSACICHVGLKPTLWDFEEEVKRKLTEREFMWFCISLLTTLGYRADIGTTFIGERGTAKLAAWFVDRISRLTNDRVKWYVGGRFGEPAHAGQFEGRSKGNYRTKKLIEGTWGLVDNQTAQIPAQTGRGRDDAPEAFAPGAGAEQYTNRILKAAQTALAAGRITPDQAAQIQSPYCYYWQWQPMALDAIHRINTDPVHDLEGWEKLNFVQTYFRLPSIPSFASLPSPNSQLPSSQVQLPEWFPLSALPAVPEPKRSIIRSMIDTDPSLLKSHRLSRQAVFDSHKNLLTPLPWELLPALVGPENALAHPLEVKSGLLRFECADIDPDPLEFYARDQRASTNGFLPNGEKYTCYVNPYASTHLVACDANNRVVAVCPRYVRACRTDQPAVNQLLGDQQAFEAAARTRLNLRHSDQASAKRTMIENNRSLLGDPRGTPSVPADPRLKNYPGDTSDFLEPAQPVSKAESYPDDSGAESLL